MPLFFLRTFYNSYMKGKVVLPIYVKEESNGKEYI